METDEVVAVERQRHCADGVMEEDEELVRTVRDQVLIAGGMEAPAGLFCSNLLCFVEMLSGIGGKKCSR